MYWTRRFLCGPCRTKALTDLVGSKLYFHHSIDCICSQSFVPYRCYLLPETPFQRPYSIDMTKHLTWPFHRKA
jgi:hypothetical protein